MVMDFFGVEVPGLGGGFKVCFFKSCSINMVNIVAEKQQFHPQTKWRRMPRKKGMDSQQIFLIDGVGRFFIKCF